MTEPLRTCVIGVGRLGAEHARLLASLPGSRLVGVCDADLARGETVARRLECRHEPRVDRLLAAADAAVVAVPTPAHASVARVALEAGCHVLVEKPLAPSLEEADGLIALADARGLRLCVGHVERYNGVLRRAAPLLDGPRFIEALRLAPFEGRGREVPVVLDLMIHDIDLVLGLAGSPVARLSAVGVSVVTGSVDIANARLHFANGAVADITASRVSSERKRRLRAFQPTGYLSLDLLGDAGEFLRRRNGDGEPNSRAGTARGREATRLEDVVERVPLAGDGREPLELELDAFLRTVGGGASSVASAREGRAALAVALEITREIERFVDNGGTGPCP